MHTSCPLLPGVPECSVTRFLGREQSRKEQCWKCPEACSQVLGTWPSIPRAGPVREEKTKQPSVSAGEEGQNYSSDFLVHNRGWALVLGLSHTHRALGGRPSSRLSSLLCNCREQTQTTLQHRAPEGQNTQTGPFQEPLEAEQSDVYRGSNLQVRAQF
jgi:hypothetical protein